MEVTPIGWGLLLAGVALAALQPKWLYLATIFFLPFTATEVANVGSGYNASGVQASMYLGSLLILRHLLNIVWKLRFRLPKYGVSSIVWLGVFVSVTGLSLVMPLWIDGRVQVPSSNLLDTSTTPLYLKSNNITGFLYMVFGLVFTYLIAKENQRPGTFRRTLKAFLAGSLFSAVWGLVELACKISGVDYPTLFNNGTSLSTLGYTEFLTGNVFRLSSVGVEPSIFAQTLLVAISLFLPFVFGRRKFAGRIVDRLMFGLLVIVLLLTTSSTAYLGVLFIVALVFVLFGIRGILSPRHVALPFVGVGLAALLYIAVPIARQVLDAALFSKAGNYSAAERLMTITNSLGMFVQYPILGIGWASVTSHDLIANILGNAGLIGLITFLIAMYSILRSLYRSIKSRSKLLRVVGLMQMDFALYIAVAVTLATSALSGFLNTFSFFWFILGLAIAGSNPIVVEESTQGNNEPDSSKSLTGQEALNKTSTVLGPEPRGLPST